MRIWKVPKLKGVSKQEAELGKHKFKKSVGKVQILFTKRSFASKLKLIPTRMHSAEGKLIPPTYHPNRGLFDGLIHNFQREVASTYEILIIGVVPIIYS